MIDAISPMHGSSAIGGLHGILAGGSHQRILFWQCGEKKRNWATISWNFRQMPLIFLWSPKLVKGYERITDGAVGSGVFVNGYAVERLNSISVTTPYSITALFHRQLPSLNYRKRHGFCSKIRFAAIDSFVMNDSLPGVIPTISKSQDLKCEINLYNEAITHRGVHSIGSDWYWETRSGRATDWTNSVGWIAVWDADLIILYNY